MRLAVSNFIGKRFNVDTTIYVSVAVLVALAATDILTNHGRQVCGVIAVGLNAWKAKRSGGIDEAKPPPPASVPPNGG